MARTQYSSRRFLADEARTLNDQLQDPLVFKAFKMLQKGESTECFIQLYEACLNGQLEKYETFKQLCGVLADVLGREGTDKKFGIRHPKDYLNFMILLRSYGGQSARQHGIIAGQFPAPSSRHLRALVAKSEDSLQNPYLIYENMARMKRLIDTIKYTGPVAVAGDCTKVRKRLTYSPDIGGHILGSVLPFDQCIVENPEEIDAVIAKIMKAKAEASQARAILVKVPLPHIPPQVVALIPTDGKDDAPKILELNLRLLQMAAELNLKVVSFAADGVASVWHTYPAKTSVEKEVNFKFQTQLGVQVKLERQLSQQSTSDRCKSGVAQLRKFNLPILNMLKNQSVQLQIPRTLGRTTSAGDNFN
ncbi:hypothetical protein DFH08DRAFT_799752 [Mycena albidolilacea]|uniref:Uncharacterized protein n=1 Tax=Mycena albidolilacea TaxID=1033008 RepID=A0AAD7AMB6_9AGAR|nr:hypothetical protein DFH08DRAFT_799752 [Mycena albidolilacea]